MLPLSNHWDGDPHSRYVIKLAFDFKHTKMSNHLFLCFPYSTVLQCVVKFIRFCIVCCHHVSNSLGIIVDHIYRNIGIIFGGNVS